MVLGLTGGFGCGKSTAAKLFAGRGFRHIDSDAIVRERVLPTDALSAELRGYGKALARGTYASRFL